MLILIQSQFFNLDIARIFLITNFCSLFVAVMLLSFEIFLAGGIIAIKTNAENIAAGYRKKNLNSVKMSQRISSLLQAITSTSKKMNQAIFLIACFLGLVYGSGNYCGYPPYYSGVYLSDYDDYHNQHSVGKVLEFYCYVGEDYGHYITVTATCKSSCSGNYWHQNSANCFRKHNIITLFVLFISNKNKTKISKDCIILQTRFFKLINATLVCRGFSMILL